MSKCPFKPKDPEFYCPFCLQKDQIFCVFKSLLSNSKTSKNSHYTLTMFLTILVVVYLPFAKTDHGVSAF